MVTFIHLPFAFPAIYFLLPVAKFFFKSHFSAAFYMDFDGTE
jgi:hypothetical protein